MAAIALTLTVQPLGVADSARLKAIVALVSRLPDLAEDPVHLIELANNIIRVRRGLDFELRPTGRTREYLRVLTVSDALLHFCAALGARDVDGDLVGEVRHIAVSIGSVGTPDVKAVEPGVHGDARLAATGVAA